MQVRASRPAGRTHVTDTLALLDLGALFQALLKAALVGIERAVATMVFEDDDIAIAPLGANEIDHAICGCLDGGALGCRIVHTIVITPATMDGVTAFAKGRADTGKFDRVAQKSALDAVTLKIIVATTAIALIKP